jgi:hypothetical protein
MNPPTTKNQPTQSQENKGPKKVDWIYVGEALGVGTVVVIGVIFFPEITIPAGAAAAAALRSLDTFKMLGRMD